MTEAQLLTSYQALRAADLVNAWAYVAAHPEEIDEQIRENEEVACAYGNGAASRELPIADFLEPLEYGWTKVGFQARQALKRYCGGRPGGIPETPFHAEPLQPVSCPGSITR
jgi:hypothetical protein